MRRGAAFVALAALLVGGIAWLVTRRLTDPRAVEAIWTSAGIAVKRACKPICESPISPSISAFGVSAATFDVKGAS